MRFAWGQRWREPGSVSFLGLSEGRRAPRGSLVHPAECVPRLIRQDEQDLRGQDNRMDRIFRHTFRYSCAAHLLETVMGSELVPGVSVSFDRSTSHVS